MLIVSGEGAVFRRVAAELRATIGDAEQVHLAVESMQGSPLHVLRDRVRRAGLLRGLDQFFFKVCDVFVLRRREEAKARRWLAGVGGVQSIPGLDSPEGLAFLRSEAFDVVVCIATSIVPPAALAAARHGFVNIHPGVLPAYRGTGNLWAVCAGDWERVGYTVHWMTEKIDAGRIIARGAVDPVPATLWELHVASLRAGAVALAALVRDGRLLTSVVDVAGERSCYQGWYGFGDYLRFLRRMRRRPHAI